MPRLSISVTLLTSGQYFEDVLRNNEDKESLTVNMLFAPILNAARRNQFIPGMVTLIDCRASKILAAILRDELNIKILWI